MVLADTTLFLAGIPDSGSDRADPVRSKTATSNGADALAAFEGGGQADRGAVLYAVSTADGRKLAEYELDSPPVFDGMAAANGRLYLVSNDGKIICFGANQ
ncbi:hypothetical protein ES703_35013 [subsurface metagenome]